MPLKRIRRTRSRLAALVAVVAGLGLAAGCDSRFAGGSHLRAQRVVLEREVDGLRALVERLERGEPMLPPDDIAIAVSDSLVHDLIVANLPFEADVDRFHVQLTGAGVQFRGSPTLQLRGRIQVRDQPDLTASVALFGALAEVRIDDASSTLLATVAVDHLTLADVTGAAQFLDGATIDEVARLVRIELASQLPIIRIPVSLQRTVTFPALTDGPVRLDHAQMPLAFEVSQVMAALGRLWISVRATPGVMATVPAAAPDSRAPR